MSNSPVLSRPFKGDHARGHVIDIAEAGGNVVQLVDRLSDHGTARNLLLDCYRGWAEAIWPSSRCDDPPLSFP